MPGHRRVWLSNFRSCGFRARQGRLTHTVKPITELSGCVSHAAQCEGRLTAKPSGGCGARVCLATMRTSGGAGMSAGGIDELLERAVDDRVVPGVVAVAGNRDGGLSEGAFGVLDING